MGNQKEKGRLYWIMLFLFAAAAFILSLSQGMFTFDKLVADPLYQRPTVTDRRIKIVAIDERTIQKYGDVKTWNRSIPAALVEQLNQDSDNQPAVIAFDIMYIGEVEQSSDQRFAEVCKKAGNVVTAVNAVRKAEIVKGQDGKYYVDENHVEMLEYPYAALKEASRVGFANTLQDEDGYIRYAQSAAEYNGEMVDSLAVAAYRLYGERTGTKITLPDTFGSHIFSFAYSGKSGSYEVLSLCDVLEGKIDSRVWKDSIVLVGAYAPGMQDAYNVPIQKGMQMYGVEIHANILEALFDGKTGLVVNRTLYAFVVAFFTLIFYVLCERVRVQVSTVLLVLFIGADLLTAVLLYRNGWVSSLIELPVLLLLVYVFHLIRGYLTEILKRRRIVHAFKKYVAPQVVEELSKKGDFQITLGGENRNIAVLFVDIRGFTPMSESLEPEQVVEILNEYLQLTTQSIFQNGGTLDKFIGDATMAVFNAPFDLEDYIYRAVCTARDIAAGSAELEKKLKERFGRSVSFGIGVNCGPAVVGNIGCEVRMDYTAIGDTVNTAARLESNAKPGQILISSAVYEAVKDRVEAKEVGTIPLKGKSNGVFVYEVEKVK